MKFTKALIVIITTILGASSRLLAAGFQLAEANAITSADFGAGAAVAVNDASIGFFNPAGLAVLNAHQFVSAITHIHTKMDFTGTVANEITAGGITDVFAPVAARRATGGTSGFVPAFHYAYPLPKGFALGIGVTVPFGLATNWNVESSVRYAATRTAVETINVSPILAYAINDMIAIGVGFDTQYIKAQFNSKVVFPPSVGVGVDSTSENDASGVGFGGTIGILFRPLDSTHIGLSFRSQINHKVQGTSKFSGPLAGGGVIRSSVEGAVTLPATTILSVLHKCNKRLTLMGSATFTKWDVFKKLALSNVASPSGFIGIDVDQRFQNSWRLAFGGSLVLTEVITMRFGGGYDKTPTQLSHRNIRLPDGDRYAVAIGGRFTVDNFMVDLGYTHLFMRDVRVVNTSHTGSQSTTVDGHSVNDADLFSLQLTLSVE